MPGGFHCFDVAGLMLCIKRLIGTSVCPRHRCPVSVSSGFLGSARPHYIISIHSSDIAKRPSHRSSHIAAISNKPSCSLPASKINLFVQCTSIYKHVQRERNQALEGVCLPLLPLVCEEPRCPSAGIGYCPALDPISPVSNLLPLCPSSSRRRKKNEVKVKILKWPNFFADDHQKKLSLPNMRRIVINSKACS